MNKIKIAFYIQYPYYFPHFLPISNLMDTKKDIFEYIYILDDGKNLQNIQQIANKNNINYKIGEDNLYNTKFDIVFFANNFSNATNISGKTIFMDHGVGTKHCDYKTALNNFDIILVEGDYRYNTLRTQYPNFKNNIFKVGFSKLDMVINFKDKDEYIKKYNLDKLKKTILYAPTFFPSSIEKMSDKFPEDFKEYNIIVKPHYISLNRTRYKKQQQKFAKWEKYSNCVICGEDEYSLIPFLSISDIMISDESSAIFEFAALDKPVILNRFLKLRWSYYLNPNKLLKRLDEGIDIYRQIGDNAKNYKQMIQMVNNNVKEKDLFKEQRKKYTKDICGDVDGRVSSRILDIIEVIIE